MPLPRLTVAEMDLLHRLARSNEPTPVGADEPVVRSLLQARLIRTLRLDVDCYAVPSGMGLRRLRTAG